MDVNGLARPATVEKPLNPAVVQKVADSIARGLAVDTAEFSHVPDLASLEAAAEPSFASRRSDFGNVLSNQYPPLDTIDRLAAMLATDLTGGASQFES